MRRWLLMSIREDAKSTERGSAEPVKEKETLCWSGRAELSEDGLTAASAPSVDL